jgi:hypothetical protein
MRRLVVCGVALLGLIVGGFPAASPAQAQAKSYVWIYPKAALGDAEEYDQNLYNELATGSGQTVYEVMDPTLSGTNCSFTDDQPPITATNFVVTEHEFSGYENSLDVPSGTQAVLLDQESWGCTSSEDQSDPYDNDQSLVTTAGQHSPELAFTTAPGLDLFHCPTGASSCVACPNDLPQGLSCTACTPGTADWLCYYDYDIAGLEAIGAKVIDIQAQSLEADPGSATTVGSFEYFVNKTIAQAKAGNSSVSVLVGLTDSTSDCPSSSCNASTLETDLSYALQDGASGAWINEPAGNYQMMDTVVCDILDITTC